MFQFDGCQAQAGCEAPTCLLSKSLFTKVHIWIKAIHACMCIWRSWRHEIDGRGHFCNLPWIWSVQLTALSPISTCAWQPGSTVCLSYTSYVHPEKQKRTAQLPPHYISLYHNTMYAHTHTFSSIGKTTLVILSCSWTFKTMAAYSVGASKDGCSNVEIMSTKDLTTYSRAYVLS